MKVRLHGIFAAALMLLLFSANLRANNIVVSNISLTSENTTDDYVMVQFDLSWENSWRISSGPANWDAAWVFVKYRITTANGGDNLWKHAWLNNTGHSPGTGTGASIDAGLLKPGEAFNATTNPGLGVFIYRSASGTSTFSITGARLRWNYGANGVADNAIVDVQVFAIEMVHLPMEAFAAGGVGLENAFTLTTINTGNATTTPTGTGGFYGSAQGGYPTGQTAPDNASWPNGYNAIYCQKYEITQQQYVDFLNSLTRAQQVSRTATSLAAGITSVTNRYVMSNSSTLQSRNGIRCDAIIPANDPITFYCDLDGDGIGGESNDGQWIACNYLSWPDGAAYSDWAGLRPMTELEFEKACRGAADPVPNEYAWKTDLVAESAYSLSNAGEANESIATNYSTAANIGNASYQSTVGSINGPLRVGIFAANESNIARSTAGASYYGIMELSGNVWEKAVTVGNVAGRSYSGLHGNGTLNAAGEADVDYWPGINGNSNEANANTAYGGTTGITEAAGSGFRGGSWNTAAYHMLAFERMNAQSTAPNRWNTYGFRAVRLAP